MVGCPPVDSYDSLSSITWTRLRGRWEAISARAPRLIRALPSPSRTNTRRSGARSDRPSPKEREEAHGAQHVEVARPVVDHTRLSGDHSGGGQHQIVGRGVLHHPGRMAWTRVIIRPPPPAAAARRAPTPPRSPRAAGPATPPRCQHRGPRREAPRSSSSRTVLSPIIQCSGRVVGRAPVSTPAHYQEHGDPVRAAEGGQRVHDVAQPRVLASLRRRARP